MAETTQPHVLLVDDSTIYLTLADILFAELAVTLVVAQGGWAALAACERQPFDLILMDLQMPDLDGIETTHRIRQLANANALTPIIAHTMDAGFSDPETWQAAGMDGYLAKPPSDAAIRSLLAQWGLLNAH